MSAKTIMVQGTASSAGKSALVTALCRIFSRRGWRVAPFKAQNMALNSFVTQDGGEIGRSQAVQAEACGLEPSVAMNPILLKPSSDRKSQVIVNGRARSMMDAREYYVRRHTLRADVAEAFRALAAKVDLVVIEGAGSPAEINLRENDLVNMGMAAMADAPVILVGDIDRGGVFASLFGTLALLEPAERAHVKGFVINKFRGDESILEPGLRQLESMTGVPVLGVMPYWDVRLEEEDSLATRLQPVLPADDKALDIAVVRLERLSNFTDFSVFDLFPDMAVRYVSPEDPLGQPDMVILPGTKNTMGDMALLRRTGMADAILRYHAMGGMVAGVCGGYQMLGRRIHDPDNAESDIAEIAGLGLLDLETVFSTYKRTQQATGRFRALPGMLGPLSDLAVEGYEIHMGLTTRGRSVKPLLDLRSGGTDGAVSPDGRVFGTYMHGIFDSFTVVRAFGEVLRGRKRESLAAPRPDLPGTYREYRLAQYDRLADIVEKHLDMVALERIIQDGMGNSATRL